MLRAEQLALIQAANQQLLAIRQQEMQYYTNTFASFGTQGSLIAGFTLGALTGLDIRDFDTGVGITFWESFFQIIAAISMGTSLHCILTTTFSNIYGPNLALRGPSGSMVRAVKGMIAEKSMIFLSFILCIVCFQLITLSATWIKMPTYASSTCTIILSIGATYWYKYCLRIYNRFKFIEPDIEWRNSSGESDLRPISKTTSGDMDDSFNGGTGRQTFEMEFEPSSHDKKARSMQSHKALKSSRGLNTDNEGATSAKINEVSNKNLLPPSHFKEGYLSKAGKPGMFTKGDWARRYFVLQGSDMFYYKSREDFEKDPSLSIKNRPISVSNYVVKRVSQSDSPPYEFILQAQVEGDDRHEWHFRCDLLDEMISWMEAFSIAAKF